MNKLLKMDEITAKRAAEKVELRDIVLHEQQLRRASKWDPALGLEIRNHRTDIKVATDEVVYLDQNGDEFTVLRSLVTMALQADAENQELETDAHSDGSGDCVLFELKATFRVDYLLNEPLSDPELAVFSKFNVVHNAWPFWRQLVSQTMGAARLPDIVVPFFRATPGEAPKRTLPRRIPRSLAGPSLESC